MDNVFRATWRTQLTKLCNAATDFLKTYEDAQVADVENPEKLEADINLYVQRIKNAHMNLQKADQAISVSIKPEDYQKECDAIIEYDDKAICTIAKLAHFLRTKFTPRASNDESNNTTRLINVDTSNISEFSGVKLKSFELKKFDGKFENWLPFWEQFKSAVHDNRKISKAAKFNFLSESLEGKAAASIAGFTPTEACYDEAINLLLEEYGNQEKIIERFVQKLMCLNKVHSNSDVNGLRRLYNEVSSTIRSLTALKVSPSQYDLMVKSILLGAIPAQLRTVYHKTSSTAAHSSTIVGDEEGDNRDKSLKNLLDFIKIEVEALEKAEMSERRISKRDVQTNYGTATGLFISDNNTNKNCIFCKRNNHTTKDCKAQLPIEEKKRILM